MALLNVSSSSLLSSKLPTKLLLSPPLSSPPHFSLPCYPAPQVGTLLTTPSPFLVKVFISISVFLLQATRNRLGASQALVSSLCESVSKASLLALLSASLLVADPALAFKVKFYSFTSCLVAEKPKEKKKKGFCLLILAMWNWLFWKGGGPYGQEVTRGQDLTGKDFSGKSLIKQDFKTVRMCSNFSLFGYNVFRGKELILCCFFCAVDFAASQVQRRQITWC